MQVQRQSWDRISGLPEDIIEKILSLIPIQDALKTSILSRRWRHCWKSMPKLVFDDKLFKLSSANIPLKKYKFVIAIFHVLLLHTGPILELCIRIRDIEISNEIDQIILHLSRTNNIKPFIFKFCANKRLSYKLPCSFFSLQGLQRLKLCHCAFELDPIIVTGFSMLKTLRFYYVKITAKVLHQFLTNCPLIENFVLIGDQKDFTTRESKCTFVELFKCLPSVQVLEISRSYIKHLAGFGIPHKLPTSLVHLRILVFYVCFLRKEELTSTLCVINSSPNLEKIKMTMTSTSQQTFTNLLDLQDYSGLNLDHLKELEIIRFHNYDIEMEFVKLIMAKSPMLKKARIELHTSVSVDEENKMLRDFLLLPFPRASPVAKFSIERPKNLPLNAN